MLAVGPKHMNKPRFLIIGHYSVCKPEMPSWRNICVMPKVLPDTLLYCVMLFI